LLRLNGQVIVIAFVALFVEKTSFVQGIVTLPIVKIVILSLKKSLALGFSK